jgi:tetratricopeptide (TPR) repeat protein
MPDRFHASADAYDPFEDTRGPVGHAAHFEVERIPGARAGEPARFRKRVRPGVGDELLPMIHRENMLLMDMAARRLHHVAQPLAFEREASEANFVVTTLDAGPSLNLWRRHRFVRPTASASARPWLTPVSCARLLLQLLQALRELHGHGFIHCDIHAGNVCVPFERDEQRHPGAVRACIDALRLIDFGHTLSRRLHLEEPLRLDPDAPESLRRVSPAFREALRRDASAGRAQAVFAMDYRLDLYALGALWSQLLEALDWSADPHTSALYPVLAGVVDELRAQDCDGRPPAPDLHERVLQPLRQVLLPAAAVEEPWLMPQRIDPAAGAAPRSPDSARETPLVVRPPPARPAAAPTSAPVHAPAAAASAARPPPPDFSAAAASAAAPGRRRTRQALAAAGLAALAALGLATWQAGGLDALRPGAAPDGDADLSPAAIDERLAGMLRRAGSGDWARVESTAATITRAAAPAEAQAGAAAAPLAAGLRLVEDADYAGAARELSRATAQVPQSWRAWSALGYARLRLGDLEGAQASLMQSLRLNPADASAWAHLGEVHARRGDAERAQSALRLAVYFSKQRARTLAHLRQRQDNRIAPAFRSVIAKAGNELERLPQRRP